MKKEMNIFNNTFSAFHFQNKENMFLPVSNSLSTLSTSQISFFSHKPIFTDLKLLETVFKNNSFEIFQFLDKDDIENLEKTNKFFLNLCDCYLLMDNSMKSLGNLFAISFQEDKKKIPEKKSKVREKYNFNKPMEQYYKNSKEYKERIKSGMRRKKK